MAKILLADDSATMQKVVDLVLREQGYEVISANTGEEAIAYGIGGYRKGDFKPKGPLKAALDKLRKFLIRVANALRGLGYRMPEDVVEAFEGGKVGERPFGSGSRPRRAGTASERDTGPPD